MFVYLSTVAFFGIIFFCLWCAFEGMNEGTPSDYELFPPEWYIENGLDAQGNFIGFEESKVYWKNFYAK